MLEATNGYAASLARQWDKIAIGGSDAHALASVGTAYTEVPGARDKDEFFAELKNGKGRVAGESGRFAKLTRDVFLIGVEMIREKSWTAVITPLGVLVPIITYLNYRDERSFSRRWAAEILNQSEITQALSLDHRTAARGGGVGMTVAKAVWDQIQSNDHRLMRRVHHWRAPRWFRILMIVATRGGDGWLWYALGLILVLYGGEQRFAAIGAAASSVAAGIFLFRALKHTSRRKRPCEIEPHCWASILPPGQIFVSLGTFHHGVCRGDFTRTLLPVPSAGSSGRGVSDRCLAHHPGNAFPQRRARGIGDWRRCSASSASTFSRLSEIRIGTYVRPRAGLTRVGGGSGSGICFLRSRSTAAW